MVTRSKAGIYKPKTLVAALDVPADLALFEPTSFHQAVKMITGKEL